MRRQWLAIAVAALVLAFTVGADANDLQKAWNKARSVGREVFSAPGKVVRDFVFGPTAKDLEKRGKKVADYAAAELNAILDAKLQKLDELSTAQLSDLSQLSTEAMDQFDATLKDNLKELEILSEREQLVLRDTVLSGSAKLEFHLKRAFLFLALVSVCVVVLAILAVLLTKRRADKGVFVALGALLLVALIGYGGTHLWLGLNEESSVAAKRAGQIEKLRQAMSQMEYAKASTHARLLALLDDPHYGAESTVEAIRFLNDVFNRPTLYKRPEGVVDLFKEADSLEVKLEGTSLGNWDVKAAKALLYFESETSRAGELTGALVAESALGDLLLYLPSVGQIVPDGADAILRSKWQESFPLAELALHYLDSYLSRPLSTDEMAALGLYPSDVQEREEFLVLADPKRMRETSTAIHQLLEEHPSPLTQMTILRHSGARLRETHAKIVNSYACMVHQHAAAIFSTTVERFDRALSERARCANNIMRIYEGSPGTAQTRLIDYFRAEEFSGTSIPMAALGGPHAMYQRAKSYLADPIEDAAWRAKALLRTDPKTIDLNYFKAKAPPMGAATATAESQITIPEDAFHRQLLSDIVFARISGPFAREMFLRTADQQYRTELAELFEFEQNYVALVTMKVTRGEPNPEFVEQYRKVARSAGRLGLFVCDLRDMLCDHAGGLDPAPFPMYLQHWLQSLLPTPAPSEAVPGVYDGARRRAGWIQ